MHITKSAIQEMDRIERLNIINSITGVKPANMIGTNSDAGEPNLAIVSSVVHLGSDPSLLGFFMRPVDEVPRHTYENITANRVYTINHVHTSIIEKAHYTSAKFPRGVSEFQKCQLTEEYLFDFPAPFVGESPLKIGMELVELMPIKANDTVLVIGEVQHLWYPQEALDENGLLDLTKLEVAGISGLNTYYQMEKIGQFPYTRPEELPDF